MALKSPVFLKEEFFKAQSIAKKIRKTILEMIYFSKSHHLGSCLSIVEILVWLYFYQMDISSGNIYKSERDRCILSKGHGCATLYAVLYERGFINQDELVQFGRDGGSFELHPRFAHEKGVDFSTGSLGHGLAIGNGVALAMKNNKNPSQIFILMSDGEMNEGSVWEAALFSGHHKLSNLIALVDYNKIQALGYTDDILTLNSLKMKWEAFGWHAQEVDGHNFSEISQSFFSLCPTKPNVIILHTVKGKGISFMENELLWHYRTPNEQEFQEAIREVV